MDKQNNNQTPEQDVGKTKQPKPKRNIFVRILFGSVKFVAKLVLFMVASVVIICVAGFFLLKNDAVQAVIADFVSAQVTQTVENIDVDDIEIMSELLEDDTLADLVQEAVQAEDIGNAESNSVDDSRYYDSPWSGVWQGSDGSVFVILCTSGASMVMYDAGMGASFTINAMSSQIEDDLIACTMIDPSCNYYAEYTFVRSGDTFWYTETFGYDDIVIYDNLAFTKTDRTDLTAAHDEYFYK